MNLVIDLIYIRSTHHLNDKLKPERESPAHNNMTERHENIIPNVPLCHSRENGNPEIAARAIRGGGACPRAFTECGAVVAGGHKGLPYEYGKFADYSPNIAIGGRNGALCHSRENGNPENADRGIRRGGFETRPCDLPTTGVAGGSETLPYEYGKFADYSPNIAIGGRNGALCHSRENGNPDDAPRAIRGGGACPRAFTECDAIVAGGHKGLPYEYGKFADYSPNIAVGGRNGALCHSRENGNPDDAPRAIRGGGACPRAFTECDAVVAGGHKGLPYEYGKFADYSPNIAIGGCVSAVGVAVAMVGGRKSAVTNREVAVVNRISALFSHIAALLSSMVLVENAIAALFCHNSALLYSISALQNHFAVGNTISDCGFAYSDCENELEGFNVEE